MRKRNSQFLGMVVLIAAFWPAGGCNKESPPPPPVQHAPVVKARPPVQNQQSSAKISQNPATSLDFSNRKDPFRRYIEPTIEAAKENGGAAFAQRKDLLPIQSFELSKFKVAGIIVGLKENYAMVIDPTGKGYVVKKGMLIGSNDGRIREITATAIVVDEVYNDNGRIRKITSRLTLPQKK